MIMFNLIAVCETAHAGHDAEYVVVNCKYFNLASVANVCGVGVSHGGKFEVKVCGINAGEVEGARWLMFFWFKCEGVYVDTGVATGVFVMLVGLDEVEV